jgi:predicted ribosomally synthesized peptide with SipW-like signal peptide
LRRLLLSLLVVALAVGLIGAAFASFTDTESSTGNTFTAGILNLSVGGFDGQALPVYNFSNLKPGDSADTTFPVQNSGNIPGTLKVSFAVTDSENGQEEPEDAVDLTDTEGDLSKYIDVTITFDSVSTTKTLAEWAAAGPSTLGSMGANSSGTVTVNGSIAIGVGNIIMGDSCTLDITFTLDQ